jgi:hypothetical protein
MAEKELTNVSVTAHPTSRWFIIAFQKEKGRKRGQASFHSIPFS